MAAAEPKSRKLTASFSKLPDAHGPMIGAIVENLLGRSTGSRPVCLTSPESALRTLQLMDGVLSDYYGGRQGAYWERSSAWKSRQNRALSQYEGIADSINEPAYRLSKNEVMFFLENGYLGPFTCEAPEVRWLADLPVKKNYDDDLKSPQVKSVCSHPSIVSRISQLLNSREVKLFKPHFVHKMPQTAVGVKLTFPWHQDVGDHNGGYRRDGSPVPTVSVWLSLSGVTESNGAVLVKPGSHRRFYGDWRQYINAKHEDDAGVMAEINDSRHSSFIAKPGEFYIFHSWLLHSSGRNTSDAPRKAFNMRFMSADDQVEPIYESTTLSAASH